jgi:SAM-dependent methyltransferase
MLPFRLGGFSDVDAVDAGAYIAFLAFAPLRAGARSQRFALTGIVPGMHVLDVGCGTGDDVRALAAAVGPHGRAAGIDASRAMIAAASARGLPANAELAVAPAEALPFADATFDSVHAERVFQHLAQPETAAREAWRVLRPGGSVFVLDQDWESLEIAGGDPEIGGRIAGVLRASVTQAAMGRELGALLERSGFRDVDVVCGRSVLPFELAVPYALRPAAGEAARRGAVTRAEADAWLDALQDAGRRGAFGYTVAAYAAFGRRG